MKVIRKTLPKEIEKLTIIPISDVHIGDKQADLKAFKDTISIFCEIHSKIFL